MTNKTEMAELNEICEILNNYGYEPDSEGEGVHINNAAKAVRTIIEQHCESSKMLEAAEARIAGIEKNLDAALYREKRVERQLLAKEAELAALHGDTTPVFGWMRVVSGCSFQIMEGEQRPPDRSGNAAGPWFAVYRQPPQPVPDSHPDKVRMDWLVSQHVEVRKPMFYGSHARFVAQCDSDDHEEHHTTLREHVDAAMKSADGEGD